MSFPVIDASCIGAYSLEEKLNFIYAAAYALPQLRSSTFPLVDPACIGEYSRDDKLNLIYAALWGAITI